MSTRTVRRASRSRLATTLALALTTMTALAPSAQASSPLCQQLIGTQVAEAPALAPQVQRPADLTHEELRHRLSKFEMADRTRKEVLELKRELDGLLNQNRNYLMPRYYSAEVNLLMFQDLMVGGDYAIAAKKYSTMFEEAEGNYVLMKINMAMADKLNALAETAPRDQATYYRQQAVKHKGQADLAKTEFLKRRAEYFPIKEDLQLTLSTGQLQDGTTLMNRMEAAEVVRDDELEKNEKAFLAGADVPLVVDLAALVIPAGLLPAGGGGADPAIVPNLIPGLPPVAPAAPAPAPAPAPAIVDPATNALALTTARQLDRTFGSYMQNDYYRSQIEAAKQILGEDFEVRRPTLSEVQAFDRAESNTTDAIKADLRIQIAEQKALQTSLVIKSEAAFDKIGLVVDRLPEGVRQTAQAFLVYARDNAVRRRHFRDILTVMREPATGTGIDGSTRMEKLFNLAVHYPGDSLLVAYARVVRSMKTWNDMKVAIAEKAYDNFGKKEQTTKDSNYARKFDRLLAAEKAAEARGDLSLTEEVAPDYLKGTIVWTGVPGVMAYVYTHPNLIQSIKDGALSLLPGHT